MVRIYPRRKHFGIHQIQSIISGMKKLFLLCSLISVLLSFASASELQAARIAASLDDNALAAQVLMTGIDGRQALSSSARASLERIPAGGIMLFRYNLDSNRDDIKRLLSETANLVAGRTGIPPLMAVDHEGGLVHRFGTVVERLPSAYSFWEMAQRQGRDAALAHAETLYLRSALEIRELGITMVLAPVVEILDEENVAFLASRSYGPDSDFVQAAASVFVRSMDAAGIACVLKHFPGNSAADPHYAFSTLNAPKQVLDEMVLPFAGIISSLQPSAVMLSHAVVPAVESGRNASLSRHVIESWLRRELGFQGIALSDDYAMDAVAATGLSPAAAAVQALNSGIDMIMVWPGNIAAVHTAILQALSNGQLSRERLEQAASRIIAEKIRYRLIN